MLSKIRLLAMCGQPAVVEDRLSKREEAEMEVVEEGMPGIEGRGAGPDFTGRRIVEASGLENSEVVQRNAG